MASTSSKDFSCPTPVLLYVQDDQAAALIFQLVVGELQPSTRLFIVGSCQDALRFLHRQVPYKSAPLPHLIVLDIHLPDGTGLQLLEQMRDQTSLADMRAVFFSTSTQAADRAQAIALGALAFFSKPSDLPQLEQTVKEIHSLVR